VHLVGFHYKNTRYMVLGKLNIFLRVEI
jgi:hypothetical protein